MELLNNMIGSWDGDIASLSDDDIRELGRDIFGMSESEIKQAVDELHEYKRKVQEWKDGVDYGRD